MNLRSFSWSALGLGFVLTALDGMAQGTPVPISAVVVSESPPALRIEWDYINHFTNNVERRIYRRAKDANSWGTPIATLSSAANTLSYTDTTLSAGVHYEYRTETRLNGSSTVTNTGYVSGGIEVPLVDDKGKVLLLVDETHAGALAPELAQLEEDLAWEGWTVIRHNLARATVDAATAFTPEVGAARAAEVAAVKSVITAAYNADPANVKAVYILGHLPVPYSGNVNVDGHSDHQGAWPADTYYADVNGTWTDTLVNTNTAVDLRNRNVPGDGKFDQTLIPSDLELQVGRVDFRNMTLFPTAGVSETELLRRYLHKSHDFRRKQGAYAVIERRGLSINAFTPGSGSPTMVSSFGGLLGRDPGLVDKPTGQKSPWFTWMEANPDRTYLIGAGQTAGGYTGNGAGDSYDFGLRPSRSVFTVLFGSYLGDWDSPNNFMRASLAGNATGDSLGLTCFWGGRPNFYMMAMGLGETVGYAARVSQNAANALYASQFGARGVHTGLMGDPTLRLLPVEPPKNLQAVSSLGQVQLTWAGSSEAGLLGYLVFRGTSRTGPFTRLTPSVIAGTSFTDTTGVPGTTYTYLVKTVVRSTTPSGTFHNASAGSAATLTVSSGGVSAPLAPGNLTVHASGSTQINLSWTDQATDETGYRVERKTVPTGSFTALATVGPNSTSYSDAGPIPVGSTYYYRVVALGAGQDSLPSNTVAWTASVGSLKFAQDVFHLDRTPGYVDIPVKRIGGSAGSVSVTVATEQNGRDSAVAGTHYTPKSETLTFADGETLKTFRVHLLGSSPQPVWSFTVRLSAPVGTHLINHQQGSSFGPVATVLVRDPSAQVGGPWSAVEVGSGIESGEVGQIGTSFSSVYWGSTWNNNGTESGRFIHRTLPGDTVITAKITAPSHETAAVMVRASTAPNSRMVAVRLTNQSGGAKFWARDSEGWPISVVTLPGTSNSIQAPYWVRLSRSGNQFKGEVSPDGVTWTELGTAQVAGMPATALWGFFQGVNLYSGPRWATFTDISVSNATIPPTYGQWCASYGLPSDGTGLGAPEASPAGDGMGNLVKYGLGISPLVAGPQTRLEVGPAVVGGQTYLTLTYTRPEPAPDGLVYTPEGSSDLNGWSGAGLVEVSSTVTGGARTVVVRDGEPIGAGRRFLRLKVTQP